VKCVSLDCPWLFQRRKVDKQAEDIEVLQELIQALELGDNSQLENLEDSDEKPREGAGTRRQIQGPSGHGMID